jgi:hypothetical protein
MPLFDATESLLKRRAPYQSEFTIPTPNVEDPFWLRCKHHTALDSSCKVAGTIP